MGRTAATELAPRGGVAFFRRRVVLHCNFQLQWNRSLAHQTLTGVFDKIRWQSADGSFVIGQLREGHAVKGHAEPGELTPGVSYKFLGQWHDAAAGSTGSRNGAANSKFGPTFAFVAVLAEQQHSREGVVQYLTRLFIGHNIGIGPKTAHKLYDLYQADAVRRLRESPAEVAKAIYHPLAKCHEAALLLQAEQRHEDAKIGLIDLFAGKGFPRTTVKDCIDRWGAKAPAFVRRDPFLLMTHRISGAGFLRCDQLYLGLGGHPGKLKRQILAAVHEIRTNGNGDTWRTAGVVADSIKQKIAGADPEPERAMKVGGRCQRFAFHAAKGRVWVADAEQARSEADICRLVAEKLKPVEGEPTWPELAQGALTTHQLTQLQAATAQRFGILTGGPGTGKTFTAAAAIRAVVERHGHGSIAICAPTGKAAVRISEAMATNNLPLQATTIHRLLCPGDLGYGTGNWNFMRNERLPLDVDFVVVDEASMIDADLLAALLRAAKNSAVLLIGDQHQLPPVGQGAPLRDLLAVAGPLANVPRGELTELHRNSGAIVRACQAIKSGQPLRLGANIGTTFSEQWNLIARTTNSPAASISEITKLVEAVKADLAAGHVVGDLVDDVQILVGVNEKSEVSRKKLNPILQQLFNPTGEAVEGNKYRVGDKAICLSNDNYLDAHDAKIKHYVCNGEMGTVTHVEKAVTWIEFPADPGMESPRRVQVPARGEVSDSFDLAYAITCHKSQGSEWPFVVVVADESANRVASREWHYTALSRAKHRCAIVGSLATVGRQCRRVVVNDRKTFLVEKLTKELTKEQS